MTYQHLLSPGKIGNMELKNRIVLAAMGTEYAEKDGTCTERLWNYYEARAKGGTGLVILETSSAMWPNGNSMPRMVGFSEDRFLPGLSELTERVHRHGAKIAAQLNHSGKTAQDDVATGRPVWVPSIPEAKQGDMGAALTQEEIATFVKAAGPDGKGAR
ncbi:MAG: effector protein, partial [Pseudomonadales bacterium]